ncbi:MAG: inorganic phosphate transporter [Bacteroidetes bacterium]|nr:inorganic phosphate transporter [Bacteroidota bacterium]
MFGLETDMSVLLLICILCACIFEFINGFHDTANAVATVIYTKSLRPIPSVVLSGVMNSVGVFAGGIAVAIGIINLLPPESLVSQSILQNVALILSLLLSAIIWNLGTWYLGIPASSSHTLIGSILGVGIMFSLISGNGDLSGVNWTKATSIGLSLLVSPLLGFGLTMAVMLLMKQFIKDKEIFKAPEGDTPPKPWIRSLLILSCAGLSFTHGSNDGQKGVGLVMLILISLAPLHFAIDSSRNIYDLEKPARNALAHIISLDDDRMLPIDRAVADQVKAELFDITQLFDKHRESGDFPKQENFALRKDILFIGKHIKQLKVSGALKGLNKDELKSLETSVSEMKGFTEYAPAWVILIISLSLGIGTMIGWKRIVVTIGEKIGKENLTYAQGASAGFVSAGTIWLASVTGLPVSTTQVLSSGVAGSMVSSNGVKNLQGGTIRNIAIAWLLTLPVSMVLAGGLYFLFSLFF